MKSVDYFFSPQVLFKDAQILAKGQLVSQYIVFLIYMHRIFQTIVRTRVQVALAEECVMKTKKHR